MSFRLAKITLIASLFLMACHRSDEESQIASQEPPKVIQMAEMTKDIKLPNKLWDMIMEASFEQSVQKSTNFIFAPIIVTMQEKNPGVLAEPTLRLEFPKAGGEIDFAKYVKNSRGTFNIFFDFEGLTDPESLKIFYVSKARKRKIDDEVYGSGCRDFYDIKDFVAKVNPKEGLQVNVTRDRHDSAVGGNFIFSYKKNKQTFISQVSFVDSKRPDLFCDSAER